MKALILFAAIFTSVVASAYSDEAVTDAEALLKLTKDRFSVGEVTRTDVNQAERFVLEMKYLAGKISKADYCSDVIAAQQAVLKGVEEEESVGQRTIEDVIRARMELHRVKALCK